jgi:hypothetical protein
MDFRMKIIVHQASKRIADISELQKYRQLHRYRKVVVVLVLVAVVAVVVVVVVKLHSAASR